MKEPDWEQKNGNSRRQAEEEVLRQYSVLAALNKVRRDTLRCKTEEEMARTFLAIAEELTGSKFGFICRLNDAGRLEVIAISNAGWEVCQMPKIQAASLLRFQEISGICGKIVENDEPVIINEPAAFSTSSKAPEEHPALTCFMGVPLKHGGKIRGMIGLANKPSGFDLTDQRDVESLSTEFADAFGRKREEEELRKVNRALKIRTDCNQALMRASDESTLLEEICRLIVRVGGYCMAWIGFLEQGETRTVRLRVQAGLSEADLSELNATWADPERSWEPMDVAIRTGKSFVWNREILTDPEQADPHEEAIICRGALLITLPLIAHGQTLGTLNIGAEDPDAFGAEEANLLEGLANDVALTIMNNRVQAERRRAEEALQQTEARYRAVVEQSADGIYLVDVDSRCILEANPAFARILGYQPGEVRGMSVYDFIAADRPNIDQRFDEIIERRDPLSYERQFRRKDGSLVDVWIIVSVISYGGRDIACGLVRDLTEKKLLEAQFLRSQRVESIGLLAGGIAHDLNNILAPILINVELLQRTLSDSSDQKMLSSIASNVERGASIVRQILTFARGMEGERGTIAPAYLLKDLEQFAKETFPKSVTIQIDIAPNLSTLVGDPTQLHQVLLNLCVNARDAMPEGGTLTLSAENVALDESYLKMDPDAHVGPYVLLTVTDNGRGIRPDILPKIFDPFFTTKEKGHGTGLGLSTVHGIVKSHGGFIRVHSEVGKGTRFQVYLPASAGLETSKTGEKITAPSSGKGELILVIEDEPSIREIIQTVLEASGYKVVTVANGEEGVASYAQLGNEIQLVITDMIMPLMDGASTVRALQKINPEVKVIGISGMIPAGEAKFDDTGLRALLQKPFAVEKLMRVLSDVLAE